MGLELINDLGLARFWGANIANKFLKKDIEKLELDCEEMSFLKEVIAITEVPNHYNKNSLNFNKKFFKKFITNNSDESIELFA